MLFTPIYILFSVSLKLYIHSSVMECACITLMINYYGNNTPRNTKEHLSERVKTTSVKMELYKP